MNFDRYDAVLLDLDGTIYHEEHALPGAVELLRRLQREGRKFACLTNSTSSPQRIAERLRRMGVDLPDEAIYTAGAAAVDFVLSADFKSGQDRPPRVYSLATEGVHELLEGKVDWVRSAEQPCDGVLVGTSTSVFATEDRQRVALEILRRNRDVKLVGICADRVYPSPRGIEFGSGAMTIMMAYAANVKPMFTGKPEAIFFHELCGRMNVKPEHCLLIGDNLESDIAGGKRVGMKTVLTLTGVARREDVERLPVEQRPDGVIEDLTAM